MLAPVATSLLPLIREAADHALAIAADAPPHAPRAGEPAASLADALPLAAALLDDPPAAPASAPAPPGEATRINDGRGQTRPAYRWLWTHLHALTTTPTPSLSSEATKARVMPAATSGPAPLHPATPDDSPDAWTFRELSELHALAWDAARGDDAAVADRVVAAARYHVGHTQPDYTTYQPWALPAFLFADDTAGFAEQQLHDVRSHLAIEGGASAVVPALLLADAAHFIESCRAGRTADPAEASP